MPTQIGQYTFRGPFETVEDLRDRPGIYVIHHEQSGEIKIAGQTLLLKTKVEEVLEDASISLGEESGYVVSVYNTFCLQLSEREDMVKEVCEKTCRKLNVVAE